MLLIILVAVVLVIIYMMIVGAIFFSAWILTVLFAAAAVLFHKKYLKWQNTAPSGTKCPKCSATMIVKKASEAPPKNTAPTKNTATTSNTETPSNTASSAIDTIIQAGSSHIWNKNGEILVCESCGYQENRLTQETIDAKTEKYKKRRLIFAILFAISLVLSIRFTYWVVKGNAVPADTTNNEEASFENNVEEADTYILL